MLIQGETATVGGVNKGVGTYPR